MAARAISSGTIAFGLVSIPVKLFPSVSPSDAIRFNNLHETCGTRIKQQFYCPKDDEVVERNETVKGYEFAKGQYVTFTAEELKAVEEQSTGGIDIEEFVPEAKVDPLYYAKAYYLAPDQGASRAYHLLAAALRRTGLVALAKYAARGKQYLTLLRPVRDGLILQQLHYPAEVRPIADVGIDVPHVDEAELDLAVKLIEQGASEVFEPDRYRDEVRERVEELIQKKVEGEDITQVEAESPRRQVIDLMSALKQSLGMEGKQEAEGGRKGPKRADEPVEEPADAAASSDD